MDVPVVSELAPPTRLLLGPGPSLVHPRVLRAMSTPLLGHLDPKFLEIMNEVRLNQLVVRFRDPAGVDDDAHTRRVTAQVIDAGVCYPSITTWRGVAGMRISVSNWSTDEDDVQRSIEDVVSSIFE